MCIHIIGDNIAEMSAVRAILAQRYTVTSELLGGADLRGNDIDAVVVSADLRLAENISALKTVSGNCGGYASGYSCSIRRRACLWFRLMRWAQPTS
jgi:hypothetical protein